ncbi:MAG: nitrous oxide-stimulated promoter family protein [Shewanella sp.]|nr:nitrous oxide-stimulated promoter family protein [Shewanella sp.]MCF1455998.1 nitrous oxide-stimulated promoter family protein [Shewanella sp.]
MTNAFKLGPVLQREYDTLAIMVTLYCKDHHQGIAPCPECAAFLQYATMRLDRCPYGEDKPTCSRCPVHCYKPFEKALAKTVMGYAGPRMIFRHPIMAIRHLIHERCRPEAGKPPNDKSNRHQRQLAVGEPRSPKD